MVVFYTKDNHTVIGVCYDTENLVIDNNGITSTDIVMKGVNWNKVAYAYYQDQEIPTRYDEEGEEIPWIFEELNLQPLAAADLPHSEHIAKLISVTPANAKPAVVRRKFQGETYDIACLATEYVKDAYQANKIQIGDYVLVSFIDEIPDTTEVNLAIVTDKIWESW